MPVSTIPISTYISGYFRLLFCVLVPTGLHLRHPMFAGPELYIVLVMCWACVHGALHLHEYQCMRSHSNWCCSLSIWMSVSSSHLDSSSPHTSSQSNSLSIEVPGTRWFRTGCHHNRSGFLYTHWSCTCHNVHSQSGRTNPTWIWGLLLYSHRYNTQR